MARLPRREKPSRRPLSAAARSGSIVLRYARQNATLSRLSNRSASSPNSPYTKGAARPKVALRCALLKKFFLKKQKTALKAEKKTAEPMFRGLRS